VLHNNPGEFYRFKCESLSSSVAYYIFCTRNAIIYLQIFESKQKKRKDAIEKDRLHTIMHDIDEELFHNSLIQYIKLLMKN